MIQLELTCAATHQFFRLLDLKLPSTEEMLLALQIPEQVRIMQNLLVEYFERNGEPIFAEEILIQIGEKYIHKDMFSEANMCFMTNVVQYPKSVNSWKGLALTESLLGNVSHALNYYSEALMLDPSNVCIERKIATLSNQLMQSDTYDRN